MTITEAIKTIDNLLNVLGDMAIEEDAEAMKLGIEALKRIQARRDLKTGWEKTPLPGETGD